MKEKDSIRGCLQIIFDKLKPGEEFSGLWLHDMVAELNNKYTYTYPDTILRCARKYFRDSFRVKNTRKSIYEKI